MFHVNFKFKWSKALNLRFTSTYMADLNTETYITYVIPLTFSIYNINHSYVTKESGHNTV
jgi:hypothetical protein